MFAMCSSGDKVDHKINTGGAPYCFQIRGMNMHILLNNNMLILLDILLDSRY